MAKLKRGPIKGLPDTTFNDCLFATGKRGYGKSYTQRTAMERALTLGLRCGWIDSMGIGWGITVAGNPEDLGRGTGPGYDVVVFGGAHGHLPISDHSGAALGATLAKATFSWVLDLSGLKSKAARVRFMADFGEALFENCEDQLLLLLDEVDLWAPQMLLDKQGPAAKLLGVMHELTRRGRIKGINVWMATQRPAEVNKGVISQADAMLVMKLTLPHDVDAVMLWLKKHVGKERTAELEITLPSLKKGQAVVYLTEPEVSVSVVQFPLIQTLDTMKPKARGDQEQTGHRAAIDLDAIRAQLGSVEKELQENDPAYLKKRIRELENRPAPSVDAKDVDNARAAGHAEGFSDGFGAGFDEGWSSAYPQGFRAGCQRVSAYCDTVRLDIEIPAPMRPAAAERPAPTPARIYARVPQPFANLTPLDQAVRAARPARQVIATTIKEYGEGAMAEGKLTPRHFRLLNAVAWWEVGLDRKAPSRVMVAYVVGIKANTGNFKNLIGALSGAGLIHYPGDGRISLTPEGLERAEAPKATTVTDLHKAIQGMLEARHWNMLQVILCAWPGAISREDLAQALQIKADTGNFKNLIGKLSGLELVFYPQSGLVQAMSWLFLE